VALSGFGMKDQLILQENWFVQSLDHFKPTDGRVWKQRYWIKLDYYKSVRLSTSNEQRFH
jgi:hypothetical protein